MRFALSAEQRAFGSALHELLAGADVPAAARAWADGDHEPGLRIWADLATTGVTALAVPAEHGGLGAHPVDIVVACEELGHHPVPGPVAESLAAVPRLLVALCASPPTSADNVAARDPQPVFSRRPAGLASPASPGQPAGPAPDPAHTSPGQPAGPAPDPQPAGGAAPASWLQALAAGDLIATLAVAPLLPYALDADAAGLVLFAASESIAWTGVGPGVPGSSDAQATGDSGKGPGIWLAQRQNRRRSVDPARRLFDVWPATDLATRPAAALAISRAVSAGTLASAAQLAGSGRALLEASVEHAQQRAQFGKPIGSFQAVKHQLADVAIGLEFARPLLYAAAVALGGGAATTARDIAAARVACADAALLAASTALQVHGAIGYTAECDISLWLLKVRALAGAWGTQSEHRETVIRALEQEETGPWS